MATLVSKKEKSQSQTIFKSLTDLKKHVDMENEDLFVVKRHNGLITGKSNLNVNGFFKILGSNIQNLFVLKALEHMGLGYTYTQEGELTLALNDAEKHDAFIEWYTKREEHQALNSVNYGRAKDLE